MPDIVVKFVSHSEKENQFITISHYSHWEKYVCVTCNGVKIIEIIFEL